MLMQKFKRNELIRNLEGLSFDKIVSINDFFFTLKYIREMSSTAFSDDPFKIIRTIFLQRKKKTY